MDSFVADDSVRGPFKLEDESEEAFVAGARRRGAEPPRTTPTPGSWPTCRSRSPRRSPPPKTDTWSGRAIGS